MIRTLGMVVCLSLGLALLAIPTLPAADPPKDTPSAAFTRTKKLKGKITVDFKNLELKEVFKEISGQLEDAKLGALSVHFAPGVSGNTKVTYAAKDAPVEQVLDEVLKLLDLGYIVVSKEKDRYDGWLEIVKGPERGYPSGVTTPKATEPKKIEPKKTESKKEEPKKEEMKKDEPKKEEMNKEDEKKDVDKKVTEEDEKLAASKLDLAKKLESEGKIDRAKVQLKFIIKHYAGTKAAMEAKELLEKLDK